MTRNDVLEPCPFCGEPPSVNSVEYGGVGMLFIRHCWAEVRAESRLAIEMWNHRALKDQPSASVDAQASERVPPDAAAHVDMVLVPRKITPEMIHAWAAACSRTRPNDWDAPYTAMLAAAPSKDAAEGKA